MQNLIGEFLSRVRKSVKALSQDAFITDRFIYSLAQKHVPWLLSREDSKNQLLSNDSVIQSLDFVPLIDVDVVEAGCFGVSTECTIKRTEFKLPKIWNGYYGPLFRYITSIDTSVEFTLTDPITYLNITKQSTNKYNKTRYAWYLNDHLYFPNLEWDAVKVEGIFEGDVSRYGCNNCPCTPRQEQVFSVPEKLWGELESQMLKDIREMYGIPSDVIPDKQNIAR